MAGIASLDDFIGSFKQEIPYFKTATVSCSSGQWIEPILQAGTPALSSYYNPASPTPGVNPTCTPSQGFPAINAFASGGLGYLDKLEFIGFSTGRIAVFDTLWIGGSYTYNYSSFTGSSGSWSGRVPLDNSSNPIYQGLEIWVMQLTTATGNQTVTVGYTNESGVTGHSTGAVATGSGVAAGTWTRLPLQAGDSGVQAITSVVGTVATAGTFLVFVMRRLAWALSGYNGGGTVQTIWDTGHPQVFAASALKVLMQPDNTSTFTMEARLLIASK